MEQFKSGKVPLLVCTDVAARGLDIKGVEYVVNFEFPLLCEDWVHRVGRTGRAGQTGVAVTFFGWEDRKHARELKHILDQVRAFLTRSPCSMRFRSYVLCRSPMPKRRPTSIAWWKKAPRGSRGRRMRSACSVEARATTTGPCARRYM